VAEAIRPNVTETLYIRDRKVLFEKLRECRELVHEDIMDKMCRKTDGVPHRPEFSRVTGLKLWQESGLDGISSRDVAPSFEVHALRPALRVSPTGVIVKQLIMILTQRRRVDVDPKDKSRGEFDFRGGSTLIFDLEGEKPSLRYAITRPIDSEERLAEMRAYFGRKADERVSLRATYFGMGGGGDVGGSLKPRGAAAETAGLEEEPFCLLHSEA
jgi:hypothetical protein